MFAAFLRDMRLDYGWAGIAMMSTTGMQFQFAVRLDSVRLRRVHPKAREALLACGYQLTDTVPVLRVLERLVAASAERDAKRVQVLVRVSENETHIEVVDRRRLSPLAVVPTDLVSRELARSSGASRVGDRGGLVLWAIVDRPPQLGMPPAG
jgi:hypothetical protein